MSPTPHIALYKNGPTSTHALKTPSPCITYNELIYIYSAQAEASKSDNVDDFLTKILSAASTYYLVANIPH